MEIKNNKKCKITINDKINNIDKEDNIQHLIYLKEKKKKEIDNIINKVKETYKDKIKIKIITENIWGFDIPHIEKEKSKIEINKDTLLDILEETKKKYIEQENEMIKILLNKK